MTLRNRPVPQGAVRERRQRAVSLRLSGNPVQVVAELCGFSRSAVNRLHKRFLLGGWEAVHALGDGPFPSRGRRLSGDQEQAILALVRNTPDRLQRKERLWDKHILAEVIHARLEAPLHASTLSVYMRRWGYVSEKVYRKAHRLAPRLVQDWMKEQYASIAAQARSLGAQVHWVDVVSVEAGIGGNASYHVVTSSTNRGRSQWMVFDAAPDHAALLDFLDRLIDGRKERSFLLLKERDASWNELAEEWAARHAQRVRLFHFPAFDAKDRTQGTIA
ncbi:MAG TPA: helix-turn-helix domain-containing protein [Flavobacteriales bacterium]